MTERRATCGECGVAVELPDGDWEGFQEVALADWQRKHAEEVHGGEVIESVDVEPSPAEEELAAADHSAE